MTSSSTVWNSEKKSAQPRTLLTAVTLLIVIANAAILFVIIPGVSYRLAPFYSQDMYSDGYNRLATNLVEGNGYRFSPDTARTLMREPGYPVFLAGLMVLFGKSFEVVKLANMGLAVTTAWLITRIARKLSSSQRLIVLAPILFLFHPGVLVAESRGGIEILFTFLLVLFVLILYRAIEKGGWSDYALSGAVLGLAVLVRSTPILFPIFVLAFFLMIGRRSESRLRQCGNTAVVIIAMFIVLSPWIIRNYLITGKFVPTASVLGVSAHAGQYICEHRSDDTLWVTRDREAAAERGTLARQLGFPFKEDDIYYQLFYSSQDELNFSRYLTTRVIQEYEKSPLLCIRCITYNLYNFWCAGKTWQSTRASLFVQLPYLIFGIAGMVLCVRRGQTLAVGPMVLLMVYIMAVSLPILAQARYSIPLIPFLSILASMSLLAISKKGARSTSVNVQSEPKVGSRVPGETRSDLNTVRESVQVRPEAGADIKLSIVIPAYNEEARLPRTVFETIRWCSGQNLDFELIVADDGSSDGTLALASRLEGNDARIRALACPHTGKGGAVRMGILNAKGSFLLFMDADGATPLEEIHKLLAAMEEGYDVAIGSRVAMHPGQATVKASFHRRIIGRIFSMFVRFLAVDGISDTQCGFKMFRREAAMQIFSRQKTVGFAFDVEILFIARRLSLSIAEIPVNWAAQPGSKVDLVKDSVKMLHDICQIRWLHRRFERNPVELAQSEG